ncbi:MAG TPA: hypothetical protein VIO33_22905, partial [Burkholderiaceae bacterium]
SKGPEYDLIPTRRQENAADERAARPAARTRSRRKSSAMAEPLMELLGSPSTDFLWPHRRAE